MKKIKTLKLNYEFKNVFNRGKYFKEKQLIVYILKNRLEHNRIGLAISTKTGKATRRNRIKRVIRAAYQNVKKENFVKRSYDIVFLWNKNEDIANLSYKLVLEDIKNAFKSANLI